MPLLEKAIAIAVEAHRGKKDKGGQPYIVNPLRVMLSMETAKEQIVAALGRGSNEPLPAWKTDLAVLQLRASRNTRIRFMASVNWKNPRVQEVEIDSIEDLLLEHGDDMREIFAKALNLNASLGMDGVPLKEKLDRLRQAVDQPLE